MRTGSTMYNENQKNDYIKFENTNPEALKGCFTRVAKGEFKYDKDIIEMNELELRDTMTLLNIQREESKTQFISLLRGYENWAILKGKIGKRSAISSLKPRAIDSRMVTQNKMIKNPEELESILKNALEYECYPNRSSRDELIIWLLYYGVQINDLPFLKKGSLDFNNKIVIARSGEYEINDKVAKLWIIVSNATFIERKIKGKKEYFESELVVSDYLFRPVNTKRAQSQMPLASIRPILANIFKGGDDKAVNVPSTNLNTSGAFYKLFLIEESGKEVDNEMIAKHFKIDMNRKDADSVIRIWRIDYDDWKKAFDLT